MNSVSVRILELLSITNLDASDIQIGLQINEKDFNISINQLIEKNYISEILSFFTSTKASPV